MPRDIPVGNGSLLVNFDQNYQLRDLYWPHVGQENHTKGYPSRLGVWVDGQFHWVAEDGWERKLEYEQNTMITRVTFSTSTIPTVHWPLRGMAGTGMGLRNTFGLLI